MVISNSVSHLRFSGRWKIIFVVRECRLVDSRQNSEYHGNCIFRGEVIQAGEKWVDMQKLGEENQKTRILVVLYCGGIGFHSGLV